MSKTSILPQCSQKKNVGLQEESDIDCCLLCEIGHMLPFISGLIHCTICHQLNRPTKRIIGYFCERSEQPPEAPSKLVRVKMRHFYRN